MKRCRWLWGLLLVLGAASAAAQSRDVVPRPAAPSSGGGYYVNSWALVIGINKYQRVPGLTYAVADAKAVADALPPLGFPKQNIKLLIDEQATKARIETTLDTDFVRMGDQDRLFVFFAGHGDTIRIKGGEEGFLLPADANPAAMASTAISMDDIKKIGLRAKAKHVLFVMDACFSGFAATRDVAPQRTTDDYLAAALREPVVQVITAGRKGEKAIEDAGHGLFTRRFLDGLRVLSREGIVTTAQLAAWLEPRVVRDSKGKMTPQYGKLDGEGQFVFVRTGAPMAATSVRPEPARPTIREELQQQLGALVVKSTIEGIDVWLGDQRIGETRSGRALVIENLVAGRYRVTARKTGYNGWAREIDVTANQRAELVIDIEPLRRELASTVRGEDGAEMVLVPAGEFWMGSDESWTAGDNTRDIHRPRHRVYLDAFYIDKYEVTNALYRRFIEATHRVTPRYWNDPKLDAAAQPVVGVSWQDGLAYCAWAGKRLPAEAEWEKSARGTDGRRYPWGDEWDDARANTNAKGIGAPVAVGSFPGDVSPYGAYDMAGNVTEWVADWAGAFDYSRRTGVERNPKGPPSGSVRMTRGGSWHTHPQYSRAWARTATSPDGQHPMMGFRCARSAE